MKELLKALLKSQQEISGITKDSTAKTNKFSYNYTSLDSILNAVKPILTNNGLVLVQQVGSDNNIIRVKTIIYHAESGECLESDTLTFDLNNSKILLSGNAIQEQGAAISYLKRYSLAVLGISVEEDNDAQNIGNKSNQRSKQQNNKPNTNTIQTQNKATEDEIIELLTVAQNKNFNDAQVEKAAGKKLNLLTSEEVKSLIERLNKK